LDSIPDKHMPFSAKNGHPERSRGIYQNNIRGSGLFVDIF